MAEWETVKTDWDDADVVVASDANRIEGNAENLDQRYYYSGGCKGTPGAIAQGVNEIQWYGYVRIPAGQKAYLIFASFWIQDTAVQGELRFDLGESGSSKFRSLGARGSADYRTSPQVVYDNSAGGGTTDAFVQAGFYNASTTTSRTPDDACGWAVVISVY